MHFEGEHLLPGQIGHFFVILAFVSSLVSTISYFIASRALDPLCKRSWVLLARKSFLVQVVSVLAIFFTIFYICYHHYYEYFYAYKHASKELEPKYLLACIWEGQEGSFLLWTIWHSVLGIILIFKARDWEAPVMSVLSFAQAFLLVMIIGIYFFDVKIGNSPFTFTREELNLAAAPRFLDETGNLKKDYLFFFKDGIGLNVLLRNYWMVIHPPILFLGFASTIVPFAFAYAGIQTKRFGNWIKPALPFALFSACILGVGIMMGGKWAYESLTFGGYWAWDPVENAAFVPWLILVAGIHTMVIYKATGYSLRASYVFAFLCFSFILYATFLTRTGILGDTSVHAFTEAGKAINVMIGLFVASFTFPAFVLFFLNIKNIPAAQKEERTDSREFWMFIGSIILFLAALFIIAKTSVPVINKIFGTNLAPPEDIEFGYNKVLVMVIIIIGLLTAVTQYFKYKHTPGTFLMKKILWPTILAALITILITLYYPLTYYTQGKGFLGAMYAALFAAIYSVLANIAYIWTALNGKLKAAGGSVAHSGFFLMLIGIIISSGNKQTISDSRTNGINLPIGKDPMTKKQEDPQENLTLVRQIPARMGNYEVTYLYDSAGQEKGRKFYKLLFERKDGQTHKVIEHFNLWPDVYVMKDNNISSNPDTKTYLKQDIYTYVSFAASDKQSEDTGQFKVKEIGIGDTAFYSNGYFKVNAVIKNPDNGKYHFTDANAALMADITFVSKDSMHYKAMPLIQVDSFGIRQIDDTLYAQNLFVRFAGVSEGKKIKIGIKESAQIIDFVTLKAYIFPYINLVWVGLIFMAIGLIMSTARRAAVSPIVVALALLFAIAGLSYMFLLAN